MDIEQVREYCLTFPGVTEDMPFGDDLVTFRIEGKIFLCLSLRADDPRFALKLSPERNEELRETERGVAPAWHWNKKHWSDVFINQVEEQNLREWIKESYQLVVSSLPKRLRENYQNI